MSLLVVHPHFHGRRTGVTRHVEEVARVPVAGLEVRVFELALFGRVLAAALPRARWSALRAAARGDGLVWHAHRNLEALFGLLLRAWLPRVRVVFTRHADGRPSAWTRWLQRRADRVVALTGAMARGLDVPATVVGHGVDVERFQPPGDRAQAWAALGQGGGRGVGVLGRLRPRKGQGDFVEAFTALSPPGWTAVLVGAAKGRDAPWAQGLTGPRVKWVGAQHDVGPWLRGCTVVVQPSRREGFGLVLLEAMACGCCVVSTRTGGAEALIEHGVTGFLVEPGDVAALRAQLAAVLADPPAAEEVGRAARQRVEARFAVAVEAEALAAVYGARA